jgi:hypothetical protein
MTDRSVAFESADAFIEGFLFPRFQQIGSSWPPDRAAEIARDFASGLAGSEMSQATEALTVEDLGIDLDWLLFFEAIDWMTLGINLGLLPEDIVHATALNATDYAAAAQFHEAVLPLIGARRRDGVEFDRGAYWTTLVTSDRSLTPSHRDFLHLMHCAGQDDWARRIAELKQFAEDLPFYGIESLDLREVDQVSWALSGSEIDDHRGDPAAWRAAWLDLGDDAAYEYGSGMSANRRRAAVRFGEVSVARVAILETVTFDLNRSAGVPGGLRSPRERA